MDPKRWQKIQKFFDHLVDKTPSHRRDYLDMVCDDDQDLRTEVERLLKANDEVTRISQHDFQFNKVATPKEIGKYLVNNKLGQGGMGTVYHVSDPQNNEFALKVLPDFLTADPQAKKRFQLEGDVLSQLSHPNICQIHDVFEFNNQACIVMELCPGETLTQIIENNTIDHKTSISIIEDLAKALSCVHSKNIFHRDIKPANIIIDEKNMPKLIDFGIAKYSDLKLTATGFILGSPRYMSPEQWLGKKIDQRCDLWALGVIFYQLICAKLPFSGDNQQETMRAVLNDAPSDITAFLDESELEIIPAIINKLLAKDIEKRYYDANELLVDLGSIKQNL